jgi:hypothetical protein
MTTIRLQVAPRVGPPQPRGARLAAAVFLALARVIAGLLAAAPAARVKGAGEEAQEVRKLALQYQQTDPRFAAELLAAADRHERLHDVD